MKCVDVDAVISSKRIAEVLDVVCEEVVGKG